MTDRNKAASKRTFHVTENMRRVTRYEVDEADLTPELADLMERLDEAGDLTEEDDRLVERLVAAAGDEDQGKVLCIDLADDADYLLTHVNAPTPAIELHVTATVEYRHEVGVTEALLAEAEANGYERNVYGVANMLDDDPDHDIVANVATRPENFAAITKRLPSTVVS